MFDKIVSLLNSIIWSPALVVLLVGAGLYFSFRTRFVQVRRFGLMVRSLFARAPLLRNKTSMTCVNTHRDGYVGRLKGFFLCKKKEIKDGLKGRLIWSMDYIYTKPNKQIVIDILMSLYSSFYPAEYAKDVTGAATSAIGLDIDNHVPAISHQIGTRKPAKMVLKMG